MQYCMQYWNPILKLNIELTMETNFGFKNFLDQKFFWHRFFCTKHFWNWLFWTTTTTTTTIEMGFDIIEINLVDSCLVCDLLLAHDMPTACLWIVAKLRQSSSYSWPELSLIFSVSHPPTHHHHPPTTHPHKLNVSNISAVTDPISTKL